MIDQKKARSLNSSRFHPLFCAFSVKRFLGVIHALFVARDSSRALNFARPRHLQAGIKREHFRFDFCSMLGARLDLQFGHMARASLDHNVRHVRSPNSHDRRFSIPSSFSHRPYLLASLRTANFAINISCSSLGAARRKFDSAGHQNSTFALRIRPYPRSHTTNVNFREFQTKSSSY